MFSKVMVANRGEIAIRVFRTLREMGIASVAVYSEIDRDALFVRHADEAHLLGPGLAAETYLNVPRILEIAAGAGVDAVHPGYGFLAENAGFARALERAGIVWIGPPADAIDAMGSKIRRPRSSWTRPACPSCPASPSPWRTSGAARPIAEGIGYPVAVKASAGGGGKGFRVALDAGRPRRRVRGRGARGRALLRRRRRLPRALPPRAAPRRDPDPGRRPRLLRLAGGARLLHAAPPPEADRGDPEPGGVRRPAAPHGRGVGARRPGGRLHLAPAPSSTWCPARSSSSWR